MKKLLLIFCIFYSLNSVYAFDINGIKQKAVNTAVSQMNNITNGNLKQIQAEKEFKKQNFTQQAYLKMHIGLLQQDKEIYNEIKSADTIYGSLIKIIEKNKSFDIPELKYAKKAKALFDEINSYDTDNVPIPAEFEKLKVVISDADFDKLSDDLKRIIYMLNVY